MEKQIDAKLIDRIRKMLALARDPGASEGEADNAMAMAHRIAQENNLSIATVEAKAGGRAEKRAEDTIKGRAMYEWQRNLMATIAEVNYCYCEVDRAYEEYTTKDDWGDEITRRVLRNRGYRLIGREANVAGVVVMYEYLTQTVNRLVLDFVGGDNRKRMTRPGVAFQEGCGDRLRARLSLRHLEYLAEQARQAREQNAAAQHPAAATSNALVVVMEDFAQSEEDLNNDHLRGWEPGTTARKRMEDDLRHQAFRAANQARADEAKAAGHPDRVVYLVKIGYDLSGAIAYAEKEAASPEKPETEAQRRKRHEREARDEQRWQDRQARKNRKRDYFGYTSGQQAGDRVSLDRQIDEKAPLRKINGG